MLEGALVGAVAGALGTVALNITTYAHSLSDMGSLFEQERQMYSWLIQSVIFF
ncbi:MAG: hypothetical protein NVS4B12_25540 [Ktedonobacteraceae bacterium]